MIDHDTIKQIKDSAGDLLANYTKEIEAAMAEEGTIAIALPVKIRQSGPKLDIEVGISFVKERIRDAVGFTVEGQQELFGPDGVTPDLGISEEVDDDSGMNHP